MEEIANRHGLKALVPVLRRHALPAIAFALGGTPGGRTRFGGAPLLPPRFEWPSYRRRPLDFLLQVDLAELRRLECAQTLPPSGLLTFFYDIEGQPWGYDPADRAGSRVVLVEDGPLVETRPSRPRPLSPAGLRFWASSTVPAVGSRAYDRLELDGEVPDAYVDFALDFERQGYPARSGLHRFLGHSANIQGDMQLEAQLVSHGLFCGDDRGFRDPRAAALEAGADEWTLLLQLDSEDAAGMTWGDAGTLYFWIRRADLADRRFDRCWSILQCG